jgi:hypothetical protein
MSYITIIQIIIIITNKMNKQYFSCNINFNCIEIDVLFLVTFRKFNLAVLFTITNSLVNVVFISIFKYVEVYV